MAEVIVNEATETAPEIEAVEETEKEETQEEMESWENALAALGVAISAQSEMQEKTLTVLEALANRLPENLTGLLESQQSMIVEQNRQMQETVRSLLTLPAPETIPVPVPEPTPESVEVVNPEAKTSPEPARRKRRLI